MINETAYINGVKVTLEFATMYHDVISKVSIGAELNKEEQNFCVMFKEILKDIFTNGNKKK